MEGREGVKEREDEREWKGEKESGKEMEVKKRKKGEWCEKRVERKKESKKWR